MLKTTQEQMTEALLGKVMISVKQKDKNILSTTTKSQRNT